MENDAGSTSIGNWLETNKKGITYTAFGILLGIRIISGYLSATHGNNISPIFVEVYLVVPLIVLSVFVFANKDELSRFNIDKYVIYTFVLLDAMLFLSFWLSLRGIIAAASLIVVRAILSSPKANLKQKENFFRILLFIVIGIAPEVLLKLLGSYFYPGYQSFSGLSIGTIFAINAITLKDVLLEEFLFRSMLWKILKDWHLSDNRIILAQAFLFWFVHFNFTADKAFALPVLIFGVWVGFLTLRSNSLMPSIATHFVHNITSRLF